MIEDRLCTDWLHIAKTFHGGKYKIHMKQTSAGKWKHCFEYHDGTWTDWMPCYGPYALAIEWRNYSTETRGTH